MFLCDFCLRAVPAGEALVPCTVCNVIVHETCLRHAKRAAARGFGLGTECGTECVADPEGGVDVLASALDARSNAGVDGRVDLALPPSAASGAEGGNGCTGGVNDKVIGPDPSGSKKLTPAAGASGDTSGAEVLPPPAVSVDNSSRGGETGGVTDAGGASPIGGGGGRDIGGGNDGEGVKFSGGGDGEAEDGSDGREAGVDGRSDDSGGGLLEVSSCPRETKISNGEGL